MKRPQEQPPTAVPATATQVGNVRARWAWTEPAVWTERMLTALENGVKGGVWFSLMDKVYSQGNMKASYVKVAANDGAAGVDHVTVEEFARHLEKNLETLARQLREGTYRPQPVRRAYIPKPGSPEKRPLGIPTVRDRVAQGAIRHVLEPIFEREFAEHSYGFRPQRGCKDALRRVDGLLKAGYRYVVDADLKKYFDTIPHDGLMKLLRQRVADSRVLGLIEAYLKADILGEMRHWTPESGAPQGAVLSPLLSNIYLNPLDQYLAQQGFEMTRYADDFVIQCRTRDEAERALALVQQWCVENGLTLHPDKTRVVDGVEEGFQFLGYEFKKYRRLPRQTSLNKLRRAIRAKTRRNNGHSLKDIIRSINYTLRGWFGYFKHSYKSVFLAIDGWVRMRLRSIERRRQKRRGRGRGYDHQRWPNIYYARQGLFSMQRAHALACQSSRR